jgi:hypothetical protein
MVSFQRKIEKPKRGGALKSNTKNKDTDSQSNLKTPNFPQHSKTPHFIKFAKNKNHRKG